MLQKVARVARNPEIKFSINERFEKPLSYLISENKVAYDDISSQLRDTENKANEINKRLKLEEVKLNELREKC